jgi:hypothetical protein
MCPEAWRRSYLLGQKTPSGIAALIGHGLHAGSQVNFQPKITTMEDQPLDIVMDAAADGFEHRGRSEGIFLPREDVFYKNRIIGEGKDKAVQLAKILREDVAPKIQPLVVEQRFVIGTKNPEISWLGYIDLITKDKELSDIKTAAKRWSQGEADKSTQGDLYPEMVKQKMGSLPRAISFNVFVKTKKPKHQKIYRGWHPDDFEALNKRAEVMLRMVKAGIFPGCDSGHWKCSEKWCQYWGTCPFIPEHKRRLPNV